MASSSSSTSSATRKKKSAILVGIHYHVKPDKPDISLKGTKNNLVGMLKFLMESREFHTNEISVLVDLQPGDILMPGVNLPVKDPTFPNIKQEIKDLAKASRNPKYEHEIYFYFSGHGVCDHVLGNGRHVQGIADMNLDIIAGEDLKSWFGDFSERVTLTVLFDSCFSGDMLVTRPVEETNTEFKSVTMYDQIGIHDFMYSQMSRPREYSRKKKLRVNEIINYLSLSSGRYYNNLEEALRAHFHPSDLSLIFNDLPIQFKPKKYKLILISGCRPNEEAKETEFYEGDGENTIVYGIFTFIFLFALRQPPPATNSNLYLVMLSSYLIVAWMPMGLVQHPCITCRLEDGFRRFVDV